MSFVKKHQFTTDEKLDMIGGGSSNGIDLNRFSSNKIKEDVLDEIKGQINYDSSNKYLLSVGRVVKDKGIIELVDTFVSLKQRYENLKLIIVGPLEEQRAEELLPQRISHEIENNPNIIHINWSDEVEYFMHLANILIHASYREGFPNVPLQAGAMECPVICSEIPGNIDIVTNNQTGLYFNVGDSKQLEERIAFALDNEDTVKSYASRLRKEIQSKFSRLFIHTELLKFYQRKLSE
jgi:glycosyltransferase involved in cell wall biosynthesis